MIIKSASTQHSLFPALIDSLITIIIIFSSHHVTVQQQLSDHRGGLFIGEHILIGGVFIILPLIKVRVRTVVALMFTFVRY